MGKHTIRRSAISELDQQIQDEFHRLVREGWTIDGIRDALKNLGAEVSRSAVGREVQHARKSMQVYAEAREISKSWLEKLEADPQGDVGRLMVQMLHALAFKTAEGLQEAEKPPKAMDVMLLSKALKDLSGTSKDAFAIQKARADAREAARRELLAEQAEKLDKVSRERGVTEETRAAIRAELGIVA